MHNLPEPMAMAAEAQPSVSITSDVTVLLLMDTLLLWA